MRYGNGIEETFDYDRKRNWLKHVSGTLSPIDLEYEYSPAGNVTQIENHKSNGIKYLGYDELDRLTSVSGDGTDSFGYDALGNRKWRGGPDPNRWTG